MTRRRFGLCLGAVFVAGLALRMIGTDWGAPYGYHFDERFVLAPALRIVETGDPNPHFFNYPSVLIYATAGVTGLHRTLTEAPPPELPGPPAYGPADLGPSTWPVLRDSRRLVALAGALGILAAALLAFRTGGTEAALLASVLVASLALHAEHSHFLTTDVPMTTLVTLAFALGAKPGRGATAGLVSGAALGLAVATKYTAGFALVPLLIVNALAGRDLKRVVAVLPGVAGAFAIACPFALLDWPKFTSDLAVVRNHYRGGHLGAEGDGNWGWYLMRLRQEGLGTAGMVLFGLGLLGVADDTVRRARHDDAGRTGAAIAFVIAATALLWFLWLGSVRVRFERNLIPAATLAAVAAGHGLAALLSRLPRGGGPTERHRRLDPRSIAIGVLLVCLAAPTALALGRTRLLAGADTRSLALAWITENVPQGATIVREEQTPRVDAERYDVEYTWSLAARPPMAYRAAGVDYLIASSAIYDRYRGADTPQAANYRRMFLWPRARTFVPDSAIRGPVVLVLEVPRLPGRDPPPD